MSDGLGHDTPLLDDVDRALIGELINDGRATYAALAPTVGLSQATVRTRVQRLLEENIVSVTGRVDPMSFGLGVFAFAFLEVHGELDKAAARIGEIDEAVFVVLGAGRFDLLVEFRCRDADHLLEALDWVRVLESVRRIQTATVLHYDKQDWSGVGNRDAKPVARDTAEHRVLDDIDRRLVGELLADGRASYAFLAERVGLSQAAARDRVIDLLDSNIVTIQAQPSAAAMDIGGFAGLAIKVSGPVGDTVDELVKLPEMTLVARTLGRFDVTAEMWFEGADHLAELLDQLRALPGIGTIDTLPYLRVAKEDFGWGGR